jgi:hypothetical protein
MKTRPQRVLHAGAKNSNNCSPALLPEPVRKVDPSHAQAPADSQKSQRELGVCLPGISTTIEGNTALFHYLFFSMKALS